MTRGCSSAALARLLGYFLPDWRCSAAVDAVRRDQPTAMKPATVVVETDAPVAATAALEGAAAVRFGVSRVLVWWVDLPYWVSAAVDWTGAAPVVVGSYYYYYYPTLCGCAARRWRPEVQSVKASFGESLGLLVVVCGLEQGCATG